MNYKQRTFGLGVLKVFAIKYPTSPIIKKNSKIWQFPRKNRHKIRDFFRWLFE